MQQEYLDSLSYDQREALWRDILSSTEEFTYVAEDDDGTVIGFAWGGPENGGDPIYEGELYAIYLLERHQRKGVGRQLTSAVAKHLLQDDLHSMLVWVLAEESDSPILRGAWRRATARTGDHDWRSKARWSRLRLERHPGTSEYA